MPPHGRRYSALMAPQTLNDRRRGSGDIATTALYYSRKE